MTVAVFTDTPPAPVPPAPTEWTPDVVPASLGVRLRVFVVDRHGRRRAELITSAVDEVGEVYKGIGTGSLTYRTDDPGAWAVVAPNGRPATTENSGYELAVSRKGAPLQGAARGPITGHDIDPVTGIGTLKVADTWQLLQWFDLGWPRRKNYADVDRWDPQADNDCGKFDGAGTGWTAYGGASVEWVQHPYKDPAALWTAKVTHPNITSPYCGIYRTFDVSHGYPDGLPYTWTAWNWMPTTPTGTGFFYGAAMRALYVPPGELVDPEGVDQVCNAPDDYPHNRPNKLSVDIHVPPNTGGRVMVTLMPGDEVPTYWLSRWGAWRYDVFTAVNYEVGDRVGVAFARLLEELALPGDTPYRDLRSDPPPPGPGPGVDILELIDPPPPPDYRRVQYSYPVVEHHNAWDVAQDFMRQGGVDAWWDVTHTTRTLRVGQIGTVLWSVVLQEDTPGRLTGWSADPGQVRKRIIGQDGDDTDWTRDEAVAIDTSTPDGAVIDEVWTAPKSNGTAQVLHDQVQARAAARAATPQILQFTAPGDLAPYMRAGSRVPIRIRVGAHGLLSDHLELWQITTWKYRGAEDQVQGEVTNVAAVE